MKRKDAVKVYVRSPWEKYPVLNVEEIDHWDIVNVREWRGAHGEIEYAVTYLHHGNVCDALVVNREDLFPWRTRATGVILVQRQLDLLPALNTWKEILSKEADNPDMEKAK